MQNKLIFRVNFFLFFFFIFMTQNCQKIGVEPFLCRKPYLCRPLYMKKMQSCNLPPCSASNKYKKRTPLGKMGEKSPLPQKFVGKVLLSLYTGVNSSLHLRLIGNQSSYILLLPPQIIKAQPWWCTNPVHITWRNNFNFQATLSRNIRGRETI